TYNPKEEVPYVAGWKNHFDGEDLEQQEPLYSSMSIDDWDQLQAKRNAIKALGEELEKSYMNEDKFVFLSSNDNERKIEINYLGDNSFDAEGLKERLPDSVTGHKPEADEDVDFATDIKQGQLHTQDSYDQPNGDYKLFDDVSGGAPILAVDNNVAAGCTAGPFVHSNQGKGWVTNYHVVKDTSSEDNYGNVVAQAAGPSSFYSSNEKIGELEYWWDEDESSPQTSTSAPIDLAFVGDTEPDKTPHEWIAGPDYLDNEDLPVTVVIADVELENVEGDSNWNLKAQGQATGRNDSYVDTVVYDSNGEVIAGMLDASYTEDGDSGGPVFHEINGEAYMCGVIVGEASPSDEWGYKTYFNTAQTVEEYLDGQWDAQ
ncbi:MAG: hypothetical protein SV186_05065, partial [Candidatus Nanohaloarchaea archaeon]|nr:hypothetical protein [Candidatus Nanohaloarchaea archaeon]